MEYLGKQGQGLDPNASFLAGTPTFNPEMPIQKLAIEQTNQTIPDFTSDDAMPSAKDRAKVTDKIDNMMDPMAKIEDKINADIEKVQTKYLKVPKDPKDALKALISTGDYKETVRVFGIDWTIRALDQGDLTLATDEIKDSIETQAGRFMALAFAQVAFSIEEINGTPIYDLFPEVQQKDYPNRMMFIIAAKRIIRRYLESLPPVVIDELYSQYTMIDARRNEVVNTLKNS